MSWDEIKSAASSKHEVADCTISARVSNRGRATLSVIVRKGPAFFAAGSGVRALLGRGEHAGTLRIVPGGESTISLTSGPKTSRRFPSLSLPSWVAIGEKKKKHPCDYAFTDDAIDITLPAWARAPSSHAPAAAVSAPAHRPTLVAEPPRGKPGVALPPVTRIWADICATAKREGVELNSREDLPPYNRRRISQGLAPFAIKAKAS